MTEMQRQSECGRKGARFWSLAKAGRRLASVIALAFALMAAMTVEAGTIRVWPTASVTSEFVALGDIAELNGFEPDTAARVAEVVIYGSPRVGTETMLRAEDVRAALVEAGVNLADVSLMGASRCRVTRLASPKSARATVDPKHPTPTNRLKKYQPRLPEHKPAGPKSMTETRPATAHAPDRWRKTDDGQTLESVLRRHITAGFSRDEGRVEIRFSPTSRKPLAMNVNASDRFRIRARDEKRTGLVSFEILFESANAPFMADAPKPQATSLKAIPTLESPSFVNVGAGHAAGPKEILVSAEVVVVKDVVVARRPINQGQLITGRDLMLEEHRFDNLNDVGLEDMAAAVGQQSKRFIRQGEMINAKSMASKPLVRRGDLVKIIMSGDGVEIETTGQAQAGGVLGEVIAVRRDGSRRKQELIDATIVGAGLVTYSTPRRVASADGGE